ncbi:MAG: tRNA lysidine(34) synthetase TilS [Ilumatobacter sp.]
MAPSDLLARCTFPAPGTSVVCALSGGPDSTALVALAVHADLAVRAVHVHHGLRHTADDDADRARLIADRLGVTFEAERVTVAPGANLEARARSARQSVLGADAMTGHTADDQAETVLLQLLRGSGATGLAAMRPGPRHPILGLRRSETHALCEALDLRPAIDPSNHDARFRRNRVRHELLGLMADIADRDPVPILARTADLVRDDDDFLDTLAEELDPTDARALAAAPRPIARRAVRRLLGREPHPPDLAAVDRVLAVADGSTLACEVAGVGRVVRSQQRLRIERHRSI